MNLKNLGLPLLLLGSAAATAEAQIEMSIKTVKTFRQSEPDKIKFREGSYSLLLTDGSSSSTCRRAVFFNPSLACPIGATGFIIDANPQEIPGVSEANVVNPELPYRSMTSITQALAIEPRRPELCFLRAAPASTLPRPSGLFENYSYAVYHNLRTTDIREYTITRYFHSKNYSRDREARLTSDIVPGVYQFSFPRLGRPDVPVALSGVLYPIPDGYGKIRNKIQGVRFTGLKKYEQGFQVLDPNLANVITWEGFTPQNVYPSSDKLYFAIRNLPESDGQHQNGGAKDDPLDSNLFPAFEAPGENKVLLANAFVKKFTLPPGLLEVFQSGHRGLVEVTLERSISTNGVTYDQSERVFQLPVKFVDNYKNYAKVTFPKKAKKTGLLDDNDGDGFLNYEEWAFRTNAANRQSPPPPSVPPALSLVAAPVPFDAAFFGDIFGDIFGNLTAYYGFSYVKRHSLVPNINFIYEQKDNTPNSNWVPLASDENWVVNETADQLLVRYRFVLDDGEVPPVERFFRVRALLAP